MSDRDQQRPVDLYELAVSNMIQLEALTNVPVRKGLVTQRAIIEEVQAVRTEMVRKVQAKRVKQ